MNCDKNDKECTCAQDKLKKEKVNDDEVNGEKEEFINENLNICDIENFIVFVDSINLKSKSTSYKNKFSVLVKEYLEI